VQGLVAGEHLLEIMSPIGSIVCKTKHAVALR
jgi:hypothetical protein